MAAGPKRGHVSEYYARGRAVFSDATSFALFILGFLGAAPFAWPALRASFENGSYDRGLGIFIARIFGSGLAAGVVGYALGSLAGRLWQAIHQWRRTRRQLATAADQHSADSAAVAPDAAVQPIAETRTDAPVRAPASMSCQVGPLPAASFAIFAQRRAADANDRRYVEPATTEILTIAAWDGLEVAGVARLLSDGYGALIITDFAVDPHYVREDVEQTLIAFAQRRVPSGGRLTRV